MRYASAPLQRPAALAARRSARQPCSAHAAAARFAASASVARPGNAYFVNLTNGIEALPLLEELGLRYSFVRMQSSLCEANAMEKFLLELDANLLLSLALGYDCFVFDFASRNRKRGVPRALWYGIEFAAFALDTLWLDAPQRTPLLRGHNVTVDFAKKLEFFDRATRQRLRYYRRYLPPGFTGVKLWGVCGSTQRDSDAEFYRGLLHAWALPGQAAPDRAGGAASDAGPRAVAEEWGAAGGAGAPWTAGDEGGDDDGATPEVRRHARAAAALGAPLVEALAARGLHLFTGGVSYAEWVRAGAMRGDAAGAAEPPGGGDDVVLWA